MTSATLRRAASTPSVCGSARRSILRPRPRPSVPRPTKLRVGRRTQHGEPVAAERPVVRRDRDHRSDPDCRPAARSACSHQLQRLTGRHAGHAGQLLQAALQLCVARHHADVGDRAPADRERRQALLPPAARQAFHIGVGRDVIGLARIADQRGDRREQHEVVELQAARDDLIEILGAQRPSAEHARRSARHRGWR